MSQFSPALNDNTNGGTSNDPFTIRNGHYVGHDGFVVPKDFDEFYDLFPNYVAKWVRKHAERFSTSEDIEDWTQDLLLHLCHLSEHSEHLKLARTTSWKRSIR